MPASGERNPADPSEDPGEFLIETNSGPLCVSPQSLDPFAPIFVIYPLQITMGSEARQSVIRAAMAEMVNAVTGLRQGGQAPLAGEAQAWSA